MRLDKIIRPQWVRSPLFIPAILFVLTLAMFADVLVSGQHRVVSSPGTDLALAFAQMRQFGFQEMRHGHIPLWNPHVFGGMPFVGGWQSEMFYPLNWIYLVLPLDKAINCEVALHVFLAGYFMSLWAARYRLHPGACLLAGAMVMFGGPYFLHIFAGHLAPLDAMAWAPLILCAVDSILDRPTAKWIYIGGFAAGMQLLAGHPQTVFNTFVAVLLYIFLRLLKTKERPKVLAALLLMGVGALALAAVQLLTGLQAAAESTRHGAVTYAFASSYSFPPENLLTALVPGFFGDMIRSPYIGRWFLWETSLFLGITGLVLAIYGGFLARTERRRILIAMIVMVLILALGSYTPLFHTLYDLVPGFNKFRGHSKFDYPLSLFIALLAAFGYDTLLKSWDEISTATVAALLTVATLLCGGFGLYLRLTTTTIGDDSLWNATLSDFMNSGQTSTPTQTYLNPTIVNQTMHFAGAQCLIAAGVLLVLTILFFRIPTNRRLCHALAVVGVLEGFVFAHSTLQTFNLDQLRIPTLDKFLAEHPGDYRIFNRALPPNIATLSNAYDMWGYDPAVIGRYSEWMTFLQGGDPNTASEAIGFTKIHPLFGMLRCKYAFTPSEKGIQLTRFSGTMPHLVLINQWGVLKGRDPIFAAMTAGQFDPLNMVILESLPSPAPTAGFPNGTARIVAGTTDSLTIEADVPHPVMLVITDVYSSEWHATALPGSSQRNYRLMPVDYMLRGIPLAPGKHRIKVEYLPAAYHIGLAISIGAAAVYLALLAGYLLRRSQSTRP